MNIQLCGHTIMINLLKKNGGDPRLVTDKDDFRLSNDDNSVDKECKLCRNVYKRAIESMKHPLRSNQMISNNSTTETQLLPLIDTAELLINEWFEDDIGNNASTSTSTILSKNQKRSSNGTGPCITPESTKKISSSSKSSAKKNTKFS
ncbi:hypothetical protein HCN44_003424 [Aphidius gifuensis]|uniref:Uncharacterized protein n=1 Tax=Aphidius gifuensis TaxID=684658 RepID=A0A834XKA6_APHGI|nr:hypothetical protein HCN44_003424 [Aphidius gifuensis]